MSDSVNVVIWSKKGCGYCDEVKGYLHDQAIAYEDIDVTEHDELRDVLHAKYGVRHVPVVEIGSRDSHVYQAVTKIGIEHVEQALDDYAQVKGEEK